MTNDSINTGGFDVDPDEPGASQRALGLPPLEEYLDDEFAPAPDRELLTRFSRNMLEGEAKQKVLDLITSFRAWHEAYEEILRDAAK